MSKQVYIATCGDNRVKVGVSSNPCQRMKELQTGNPNPIHLLEAYPSDNAERSETQIHKLLDCRRINGEWFDCDPDTLGLLRFLFDTVGVDAISLWAEHKSGVPFNLVMQMIRRIAKLEEANTELMRRVNNGGQDNG